jgi:hypothetical protein
MSTVQVSMARELGACFAGQREQAPSPQFFVEAQSVVPGAMTLRR